jgi:hypothetical protein
MSNELKKYQSNKKTLIMNLWKRDIQKMTSWYRNVHELFETLYYRYKSSEVRSWLMTTWHLKNYAN